MFNFWQPQWRLGTAGPNQSLVAGGDPAQCGFGVLLFDLAGKAREYSSGAAVFDHCRALTGDDRVVNEEGNCHQLSTKFFYKLSKMKILFARHFINQFRLKYLTNLSELLIAVSMPPQLFISNQSPQKPILLLSDHCNSLDNK